MGADTSMTCAGFLPAIGAARTQVMASVLAALGGAMDVSRWLAPTGPGQLKERVPIVD